LEKENAVCSLIITSKIRHTHSFALKKGDILFASSGETAEDIGKCFAYLSDEKAVAGGDIIILRPKNEYDPTFLGYILNSSTAVGQKSFMGQGSSVFHIYSSNLSQLILPFPPTLAEQTAIATALSDMDAEIEQLEAQLAKYRQLKRGMMQELLTGRKRLI
jgi:type I restriction enzyme S subunit